MRNALLAAHLARAWRAGSCSAVVGARAALGRARAQTFGCYGRGPIAAGDASAGVCRRIAYAWRRCTASECTVVRAETGNSNAVVGVIAGVFACGKRDHGSDKQCSADLHRTSLDPFHAAQERTDQVSGSKRGQEVAIALCALLYCISKTFVRNSFTLSRMLDGAPSIVLGSGSWCG